MKKLLVIILSISMILSVAACGEKSFDYDKALSTLKNADSFKDAKEIESDDVEIEYDITLEDTEDFCMYKDSKNFNMFIIAKAKEGNEKLMYTELQKIVDAYSNSITESTYQEIQVYSTKVNDKYVSKADGVYICIISDDSEALGKDLGK